MLREAGYAPANRQVEFCDREFSALGKGRSDSCFAVVVQYSPNTPHVVDERRAFALSIAPCPPTRRSARTIRHLLRLSVAARGLRTEPERVTAIYGVPARIPVQIEPARHSDRIFLRGVASRASTTNDQPAGRVPEGAHHSAPHDEPLRPTTRGPYGSDPTSAAVGGGFAAAVERCVGLERSEVYLFALIAPSRHRRAAGVAQRGA